MPPKKKKTLSELVGKQVVIRGRLDSDFSGPFLLSALDLPFVCLEYEGEYAWWNTSHIEAIREAKPENEAS